MDPFSMISAYIAEDLSEEEALYFEAAVRQDPVLQRKLLEAYEFEQLLKRTLIQQAFEEMTLQEGTFIEEPEESGRVVQLDLAEGTTTPRWVWFTRVAAVGLMLLAFFLYDRLLIGPDISIQELKKPLSEVDRQQQLEQEKQLKEAVVLDRSNYEAVQNLAEFYMEQGDLTKAQGPFEQLLDFQGEDPTDVDPENTRKNLQEYAEYQLMRLHLSQRHMAEFDQYAQQILENPKHKYFESAQDLIRAKKQNFGLILGGCVLLFFLPSLIRAFHQT